MSENKDISFTSLTGEYGSVDMTKNAVAGRVFKGLYNGLRDYCGSVRMSLILWADPTDKRYVFDPCLLLQEHERAVRQAYQDKSALDFPYIPDEQSLGFSGLDVQCEDNFEFDGLLSVQAKSNVIFHQQWLVELPKNVCHNGPIISWIIKAVGELVHDLKFKERVFNKGTEFMLSNFSREALFHFLLKTFEKLMDDSMAETRATSEKGMKIQIITKSPLPIMNILNSVTKISTTREEGASPTGLIAFLPTQDIDQLIDKCPCTCVTNVVLGSTHELNPSLKDAKFVRKLLALTNEQTCLLSDGSCWYLSPVPTHPKCLLIKLNRGRGEIYLGEKTPAVCTFSDGKYFGTYHYADLSDLSKTLDERSAKNKVKLLRITQSIVDQARRSHHGCTIILDLAEQPHILPGPKLSPAFDIDNDENMNVVQGMSKIDGALHIDSSGYVLGFAKILDGSYSSHEDPARGARYNSAIRFVEKSGNDDIIIVVASEDGPVTIVSRDKLPYLRREQFDIAPHLTDLDLWFATQERERQNRELASRAPVLHQTQINPSIE